MAVILMLHEAGKVAAVKKLMCCLLIVWMTLLAGGANAMAHGVKHHTHDHGVLATFDQPTASQDNLAVDADYPEKSSQHQSGHCHTHHQAAGLPSCYGILPAADLPNFAPALSQHLAGIAIANNIERPKWLAATPAVVSLLT